MPFYSLKVRNQTVPINHNYGTVTVQDAFPLPQLIVIVFPEMKVGEGREEKEPNSVVDPFIT